MNIHFLNIASQELDDAIDFYNAEREGLGDDFWIEVKHALNSIKIFPKAWLHYLCEPSAASCDGFLTG